MIPSHNLMKYPASVLVGLVSLTASLLCSAPLLGQQTIRVLFLGDRGHHRPAERSRQLIPYLLHRGIKVHYTESLADLTPRNLARYDALMVYANIGRIHPAGAKAVLDYVEGGGGYVPLHCASYCFNNDPRMIALTGAQFRSHKTGTFRTQIVKPEHPVMKGFAGFESFDETYVHHKHNDQGRTILSRRQTSGDDEPWTWVRSQGKGRVFYTAWGHDQRTWSKPGFCDLVERGIRWATGDDDPSATMAKRSMLKPFQFKKAKVAYYPPRERRGGSTEWPEMQLPLLAEESVKHIITPAGFEARLFAAEPHIRPVIAMTWDNRGRLWVCESIDYPNRRQGEGSGNDSIKICEDTNGDGMADKFTVFADKLSIPTAITFANGGVIVQQAPDTLFLKDTDGDDRADVRKKLISGWGTGDTHAGPSNLQYGLDNQIWGMVGYSSFNGKVGGESLRFGSGFYRMARDGSKLEFIRSTNNNTWGIGFTEDGLLFGSTANGNPSCYMPIPNRYYTLAEGLRVSTLGRSADNSRFLPITEKFRQVDVHGGYTAAAGHAVYTARTYPESYWNKRAFVTGPTGKLVGTFELIRNGADVTTTNPFNLVSSDDEWTGPIMAEVGPDGHVWFIDFYNYIIQHNPTPKGHKRGPGNAYITKIRDKLHTRIYRVVYTEAKPRKSLDLSKASPTELVTTLRNDNMRWRMHAQRMLVERGKTDVADALINLVGDRSVDKVGLNTGAIHGLWTLHGLGVMDGSNSKALAAATRALSHPSAGVRRNAVQVLPGNASSAHAILAAGVLNDDDAQVRLAALLALADMPPSMAVGAMIYAVSVETRNAQDQWMADALKIAGSVHYAGYLAAAKPETKREPVVKAKPLARANLIPNPSFEHLDGKTPRNWTVRTYGGKASHAVVEGGHTGKYCVKISSASGSDTSWFTSIKVKPRTRYQFSGWIKTDGVGTKGGAHGALFNAHMANAKTTSLKGTADWRRVTGTILSGKRRSISINCLFGGWGFSTGAAYFDDVEVIELGPESGAGPGDDGIVAAIVHHAKVAGGQLKIEKTDSSRLLSGGDAARGKHIFFNHQVAGCFRCHKVGGKGGIIAPALDGIAGRKDTAYLLQSLIDPNDKIAEGFPGKFSPMPPMNLLLKDQEIRDVLSYLKTLK
jgi:putative membrane-bound dehydrogenase-like protein